MAVCKRCGTVFDYNKREGVCPKCCFYNRPANSWQEDESWTKNYNFEDNSYDINLHESEEASGDHLRDVLKKNKESAGNGWPGIMGHAGHKEVDGSHIHTNDGRVITSGNKNGNASEKYGKKARSKFNIGSIVFIVIVIYFLYSIFSIFIS